MRLALLGGTGDIGEGLALRWAYESTHEVVIGSRDPDRARAKAGEYETELASRGVDRSINGFANAMAADRADVIVVAVPARHAVETVRGVAETIGEAVVVSPAVAMARDDDGFHYDPPAPGSVTAAVDDTVPSGTPVVGAFHNLAADRLANLDVELDHDVVVVGDDPDAKETVVRLVEAIDGLRGLDGGPVANAPEVEAVTPLLINLAINNPGLHDLGVRFE